MNPAIIFPATNNTMLGVMLRRITAAVNLKDPTSRVMGILGGTDRYGVEWNSDVFEMHPYCWCDREDCPWCIGGPVSEWTDDQKQTVISHGGLLNQSYDQSAPNFWHKPSGLRVWWYKYIGRSMTVSGEADLTDVIKDCLADINLIKE